MIMTFFKYILDSLYAYLTPFQYLMDPLNMLDIMFKNVTFAGARVKLEANLKENLTFRIWCILTVTSI
jgi:hypothetical protein